MGRRGGHKFLMFMFFYVVWGNLQNEIYFAERFCKRGTHKISKALFATNIFHTVSQQNKTKVLSVKENNLYSHLLLSETISLLCFQNYLYFFNVLYRLCPVVLQTFCLLGGNDLVQKICVSVVSVSNMTGFKNRKYLESNVQRSIINHSEIWIEARILRKPANLVGDRSNYGEWGKWGNVECGAVLEFAI